MAGGNLGASLKDNTFSTNFSGSTSKKIAQHLPGGVNVAKHAFSLAVHICEEHGLAGFIGDLRLDCGGLEGELTAL